MIEIPLTNEPSQSFTITINEVVYGFRVIYNTRKGTWTYDLSVGEDDIAMGVTMVGGVDLMDQYNYDLKNIFAVNISDPRLDATADNLGTDVILVVLTNEELADGFTIQQSL